MFMVNNILVTDNQMFITFTNKNKKLMKLTFLPIFVYSDFSEWTQANKIYFKSFGSVIFIPLFS